MQHVAIGKYSITKLGKFGTLLLTRQLNLPKHCMFISCMHYIEVATEINLPNKTLLNDFYTVSRGQFSCRYNPTSTNVYICGGATINGGKWNYIFTLKTISEGKIWALILLPTISLEWGGGLPHIVLRNYHHDGNVCERLSSWWKLSW